MGKEHTIVQTVMTPPTHGRAPLYTVDGLLENPSPPTPISYKDDATVAMAFTAKGRVAR